MASQWLETLLHLGYRVAEIQDVKVALEAGYSPQMIFSNYRELVFEEDAKNWFEITPSENISLVEFEESQAK